VDCRGSKLIATKIQVDVNGQQIVQKPSSIHIDNHVIRKYYTRTNYSFAIHSFNA